MNNTNRKLIYRIASLMADEENLRKFTDSKHPEFEDYGDRGHEHWHDKGWNNGIIHALSILGFKWNDNLSKMENLKMI